MENLITLFHQLYPEAKKEGNEYLILCPEHDDHTPSLSVNTDKEVFNCLACGFKGHISQLPLIKNNRKPSMPRVYNSENQISRYEWLNADGNPSFRLVRIKNGDKKTQFFEKFEDGKWIRRKKEIDGPLPLILYRLNEVLSSDVVYIVEGEKDVESLRSLGYVATTNSGGVSAWKPEHSEFLRDKSVILLADNDVVGKKRLFSIGYKLRNIAKNVGFVPLPGLGPKEDVTDFLEKDPENKNILPALLEAPEQFPWERTEEWVEELNKKYACSWFGNKFIIIKEGISFHTDLPKVDFVNKEDFRTAEIENGKRWLEHPHRRQYEEVVFVPKDLPDSYYNLWKGFAVEPKENPELTKRFWGHVENNICNGDPNLFEWVKAWCASMVQKPYEPAETSIVLRGEQGTGKSIFAVTLGRLFGQHFFHASSPGQFAGRFNSHLIDKVLVFGDEAFWGGDKQSEGVLKRLITEKELAIEAKGKDIFTLPNFIHLILASNQEWVVPAGVSGERRFTILDVLPTEKQNRVYFGKLQEDLDNGGYEALLFDLLHYKSEINPKIVPRTKGLREQQELSAPTEIQFFLDVVETGSYLPGWDDDNVLPFTLFYEHYEYFCSKNASRQKKSKKALGMILTKMFGESVRKRILFKGENYNIRCYTPRDFQEFIDKTEGLFG